MMTTLNEVRIDEDREVEGKAFPLTMTAETVEGAAAADLCTWIGAHLDEVFQRVQDHGAILFRGFAVNTPDDFSDVVDALQVENMPYIGGAAVRNKVAGDKVLTANEAPPSEPIPFHHEMAQVPSPPHYLVFCCDTPAPEGGETPIILSSEVYDWAAAHYPEFMKKVEDLGVRYVRILPEEDDPASAIGRSWKSTYQTESLEEAVERMRDQGTEWEWLEGGNLKTITAVLPAVKVDERTGRKTFFNAMVAAYTGWIDSRNDPKKAIMLGDGTPVDQEAMSGISQFMDDHCVKFRWIKGDVLLVDNRLAMHSRSPFTPPRRILASVAKGRKVAV